MTRQRTITSSVPHELRLVQQVSPGTPGAVLDPVFGCSWIAAPRRGPQQGLNGKGGFVQAQTTKVLADTGNLVVTIPASGSDGRNNRDRLYFYADTPDPTNPTGQRVGYMPGDEWVELWRDTDLIAAGTPVNDSAQLGQIDLTCTDFTQTLQKQIETAAGYWCNSPRDVFEHYTRVWLCATADDFTDTSQWPSTSGSGTTPNGRFVYTEASTSPLGPSFVRLTGSFTSGGILLSAQPFTLHAADHAAWRAETEIAAITSPDGGYLINLTVLDQSTNARLAVLGISPYAGSCFASTSPYGSDTQINVPLNIAGLVDGNNQLLPPYTLAIEARERFIYFYLDGQQIGVGLRPQTDCQAVARVIIEQIDNDPSSTTSIDVDYLVTRYTSPPMNGGDPGDYQLPSAPETGGLSGRYWDMDSYGPTVPPPTLDPTAVRTDPGVSFTNPPTWMPGAMQNSSARFVRWTGSIYLPLADRDVHFQLPATDTNAGACLWVGRTRAGESICQSGRQLWPAEPAVTTSVGLRSLLGTANGWYPLIFEYLWTPSHTASDVVGFEYDAGGTGSYGYPTPDALSPTGLVTQQVTGGHFDQLKTLSEQFAYQWLPEPRALESGAFPGVIIPRGRVGRDTDLLLGEDQVDSPQGQINAADCATTTKGDGQGLGGASTGSLTAEAFNFDVMRAHPYVLTETESLPSVTDIGLLTLQLETLLELRSEPWEQVQVNTPDAPEKRDTFPLTGQLAEFDWNPGDGIRRWLPAIGITDTDCIQIQQLQRTVYPDGAGPNQASFFQRPRRFTEALRRFLRQTVSARRQFQGQLAISNGNSANGPAVTSVPLPPALTLVRGARMIVTAKSDASSWAVNVNGSSVGVNVTKTMSVDLSNYIGRNALAPTTMIASLTGGTGTVSYVLQLTVLIPQA